MAPNLSSLFASYFSTAFRAQLDSFYGQISKRLIDNDPSAVDQLFEKAIEDAVI